MDKTSTKIDLRSTKINETSRKIDDNSINISEYKHMDFDRMSSPIHLANMLSENIDTINQVQLMRAVDKLIIFLYANPAFIPYYQQEAILQSLNLILPPLANFVPHMHASDACKCIHLFGKSQKVVNIDEQDPFFKELLDSLWKNIVRNNQKLKIGEIGAALETASRLEKNEFNRKMFLIGMNCILKKDLNNLNMYSLSSVMVALVKQGPDSVPEDLKTRFLFQIKKRIKIMPFYGLQWVLQVLRAWGIYDEEILLLVETNIINYREKLKQEQILAENKVQNESELSQKQGRILKGKKSQQELNELQSDQDKENVCGESSGYKIQGNQDGHLQEISNKKLFDEESLDFEVNVNNCEQNQDQSQSQEIQQKIDDLKVQEQDQDSEILVNTRQDQIQNLNKKLNTQEINKDASEREEEIITEDLENKELSSYQQHLAADKIHTGFVNPKIVSAISLFLADFGVMQDRYVLNALYEMFTLSRSLPDLYLCLLFVTSLSYHQFDVQKTQQVLNLLFGKNGFSRVRFSDKHLVNLRFCQLLYASKGQHLQLPIPVERICIRAYKKQIKQKKINKTRFSQVVQFLRDHFPVVEEHKFLHEGDFCADICVSDGAGWSVMLMICRQQLDKGELLFGRTLARVDMIKGFGYEAVTVIEDQWEKQGYKNSILAKIKRLFKSQANNK